MGNFCGSHPRSRLFFALHSRYGKYTEKRDSTILLCCIRLSKRAIKDGLLWGNTVHNWCKWNMLSKACNSLMGLWHNHGIFLYPHCILRPVVHVLRLIITWTTTVYYNLIVAWYVLCILIGTVIKRNNARNIKSRNYILFPKKYNLLEINSKISQLILK